MELVNAATKGHLLLKDFIDTARKTWGADMESLLQTRIVDVYGIDSIGEAEVKYFKAPSGAPIIEKGKDFMGMLNEAIVAFRGVDLYHVVFYANRDSFVFEAYLCQDLEKGALV